MPDSIEKSEGKTYLPTLVESHATTLNVTFDETLVYERGELLQITKKELVGNETAIGQLINSHNVLIRENKALNNQITSLEEEKSIARLFPIITSCLSGINALGVLLIGFGVNYLNQPTPPPCAGWLLGAGIPACLATAIAQPLVPWLVKQWLKR